MKIPATQNQEVLFNLIKNRSLTSIELRKLTSSSYPPARIADVQDYGISINHTTEKYQLKSGRSTHITRYTLLTPIKDAKEIYKKIS